MAPCNGTTSTPPKVGRHTPSTPPPNHSTLQWHPAMAPRPLLQSWPSTSPAPTMAHHNGTQLWHHAPKLVFTLPQQWHHVHSPKLGRHPPPQHTTMAPAMAPPAKLAFTFPSTSTLQWHPAMAPSNGTTSTPPKLVVTLPPNHSKLQWHPAMAPHPPPKP